MKTRFTRHLLFFAAALMPFSNASGQIVIQHLGAADPVTEGFTLSSTGDVQLGSVLGDLGFDSWKIHSRIHNESAVYRHGLTPDERQAAMTNGWVFSANMRFVEVSEFTDALMEFHTETRRFRLTISAIDDGEIVVSGDAIQPFSLQTDALDYHEYTLVYNAVLDQAALWIDGIERVSGISGGTPPSASTAVFFGDGGQSITYSHWNEVTFTIIPEPTTVALLLGLGALLFAGAIRHRKRGGEGK